MVEEADSLKNIKLMDFVSEHYVDTKSLLEPL
jgi:hypothetical protein